MVAYSAFAHVFSYLPWRAALPAAVGVAAIIHVPEVVREDGIGYEHLVQAGLTIVIVALISLTMRAVAVQSARRQRLIEELQATRHELAIAEREAGMLEERGRLAGDVHDTVTQGLSSIVMLLEAAHASMGARAPGAASHVEQALQTARDSLREVRSMVWALRPESLESGTLAEAVARVAERFEGQTGTATRTVISGAVRRLPTEVEVTLLQAVQEALANVRRHARARAVTITLSYLGEVVALDVRDDGIGFDPQALPIEPGQHGGLGHIAMRERVEALGGSLAVESSPGQGSTVAVELPASPSPNSGDRARRTVAS